MNQTDRPVANPNVVLQMNFDDWAVLFNPDTADAVGTNPVGVAVWKQLDGRRSLKEIVETIGKSFDDTPDTLFEEIAAFINTLAENGFAGLELEGKKTNESVR